MALGWSRVETRECLERVSRGRGKEGGRYISARDRVCGGGGTRGNRNDYKCPRLAGICKNRVHVPPSAVYRPVYSSGCTPSTEVRARPRFNGGKFLLNVEEITRRMSRADPYLA